MTSFPECGRIKLKEGEKMLPAERLRLIKQLLTKNISARGSPRVFLCQDIAPLLFSVISDRALFCVTYAGAAARRACVCAQTRILSCAREKINVNF